MATVAFEKSVKCRHITEGCVVAYWCILPLALTIRFKAGFVKRHDTIGILIHAFYRRMDSSKARALTRNKANSLLSISCSEKMRPTLARGRTIVDHNLGKSIAFKCENNVLVFHFIGPRALGELFRRPAIDEF